MPDSDVCRTVAWVPWCSGWYVALLMSSVSSAWPLGVSVMFETDPMELPATCTWSPVTSWLAFAKIALTW